MKKFKYNPSGRKIKSGTEQDLAIFIQSHCLNPHPDPLFYIEPDLENLKVSIENKLMEMPRRSVAAPWQMFKVFIQKHSPYVLRVQKVSGSKTEEWCTVSIEEV